MATNRHDTLDPALLRPGRLDRKIEFPMPDRRQKRLIFSTICTNMNLSDEVDLEDCILFNQLWWSLAPPEFSTRDLIGEGEEHPIVKIATPWNNVFPSRKVTPKVTPLCLWKSVQKTAVIRKGARNNFIFYHKVSQLLNISVFNPQLFPEH